jgi:hypothetical protein
MRQVLVAQKDSDHFKKESQKLWLYRIKQKYLTWRKLLKKTKVLIKLTVTENAGSLTTAQKTEEKPVKAFY